MSRPRERRGHVRPIELVPGDVICYPGGSPLNHGDEDLRAVLSTRLDEDLERCADEPRRGLRIRWLMLTTGRSPTFRYPTDYALIGWVLL